MANNTRSGIKKSQFTATNTVNDDGTLDYVYNGQNLKITFQDLVKQLDVTGQITQVGDPLGSPVLDKQGTLNAIRNIKGGFGMKTLIDAQNSVEISTNFSFDQVGVTAVENVSSDAPNWRSFIGGQDINVTGSGGTITIDANTDGLKADNQVIVNQISDFGTPSGGEYLLSPGTEYYIGRGDLVINDALRLSPGTAINGSIYPSSLTYTGTGGMFRGTNVGVCSISNISIACPNATVFQFSDTAPASIVNIETFAISACDKIADVSDVLAFTLTFGNCLSFNEGVDITGTAQIALSIDRLFLVSTNATATHVNLGSNVFTTLELQNISFNGVPGATAISGLASNGNVAADQVSFISACEFTGGITELSGITVDDFRYLFSANSGLQDTDPDALLSLTNNSTETIISEDNTPVKVAGTWVIERTSQFTGDTTGRATYDGERALSTPITISLAIEPASGTNKDMTAYVTKNGSIVANSSISARGDSGNPRTITLVWQDNLVNADYIELWVENNSDTVNLIVRDAVLRLR